MIRVRMPVEIHVVTADVAADVAAFESVAQHPAIHAARIRVAAVVATVDQWLHQQAL